MKKIKSINKKNLTTNRNNPMIKKLTFLARLKKHLTKIQHSNEINSKNKKAFFSGYTLQMQKIDFNIINILDKCKLYYNLFNIKIFIAILPFITLLILTNFLSAFLVFACNTFVISFIFKIASDLDKKDIKNKKDYIHKKSKREAIALLFGLLSSLVSFYLGRIYSPKFVNYLISL
jgi:hypothetical protein